MTAMPEDDITGLGRFALHTIPGVFFFELDLEKWLIADIMHLLQINVS